MVTENRLVVAWGGGEREEFWAEGGGQRKLQENDEHVHYLGGSDRFMGVDTSKLMCRLVHVGYTSLKLF